MNWIRGGIVGGILIAGVCTAQQAAFDAASVKVFERASGSRIGTTGGPGTSDPGRIQFGRVPMIQLLTKAYGVKIDEVSGPSWIRDFSREATTYDITATMPPATTQEQFQAMLRNLLRERFHLAVHHETKKFPGYNLVIAKDGPRLKEAQPNPRVDAVTGPVPSSGNDGFPRLPPRYRCVSTISSGAERIKCSESPVADLAVILGGMIASAMSADREAALPRVIDKTGLTGKYDLALEFSCERCLGLRELAPVLAARGHNDAEAGGGESTRNAGLPNIFVALEKQLGLKVEKAQPVPVDVVVVDHVDKVPTAN